MRPAVVVLAALCALPSAGQSPLTLPSPALPLIIDGNPGDTFWQSAPAYTLSAAERGVPAAMGGQVRLALHGNSLCILARLPEPGGKVLAHSIGINPIWEKDSARSPAVEDRIRIILRRGEGETAVEVNPWGARRIERNGRAINADLMAAAAVGSAGWDVEVVVPAGPEGPPSGIRVERIRSRRPLAPEFRWNWPAAGFAALPDLRAKQQNAAAPVRFAPPPLGNRKAPLEVGRVAAVPSLETAWDDPAWNGVPGFELPRAGSTPGRSRYPTEVRWVQDGRTLAIIVRAAEPEPVVARAGGRDSAVAADDSIGIHLATSGSAFVEFAINSAGAIQDAIATGPHIERPRPDWNAAGFQVQTNIRYGAWTARMNVPLAECAAALGETGVPRQWRIVLSRYRAAHPGEAAELSAIPAIGSEPAALLGVQAFLGPALYRRMLLSGKSPSAVAAVDTGIAPPPAGGGLAPALAAMDPDVWSPFYRRFHSVRTMLRDNQRRRVDRDILKEREEWDRVRTKEDWEHYRDARLKALRASIGVFPPARAPLGVRITATREGDGYRLQNIVYQTRPGFYAAANLYLPPSGGTKVPVIVIQHSQHLPRTQGELHDMGKLWARHGTAVLLLERLGFGERVETTPRYRQAYAARFTFKKQLDLVGESHMAWMAWDIIRAVDLLCDRPEIDRTSIILIGAVAGGGEPAALAAALDPRITAVIPYNYDFGHVRLDADYFGEIPKQISPWFMGASIAPRKFVRAFEFGWEGAEEPDYPELWVSGWERSQKVWKFYSAPDNLASIQAFGLIRLSMERIQHCFNVGPAQRKEMYPLFERWFHIRSAAQEDAGTLPDSELTYNALRAAARAQEARRRGPDSDVLCIPPAVSAELRRKPLHELALEMAEADLARAREQRDGLGPAERARALRDSLRPVLGDVDPREPAAAEAYWKRSLPGATAEGIAVHAGDGIDVPLIFLRPANASGRLPVVVAVAQSGKEAFLATRGAELAHLVAGGAAVCMPDLRGTGETSPDQARGDDCAATSAAELETALGGSLVGDRVRDLRTVIEYVRNREDVDGSRVAVWGDSFAPANRLSLPVGDIELKGGPELTHEAEPAGALIAMLAGLFDQGIRAVAALGGLAETTSVLRHPFPYVPEDALVPGILKTADIADITAALAPRSLLVSDCRDGRNIPVSQAELDRVLEPAAHAYAGVGQSANLTLAADTRRVLVTDWLLKALSNE